MPMDSGEPIPMRQADVIDHAIPMQAQDPDLANLHLWICSLN